ncbi:MAG: Na+/H+ antiporter NhaC [Gammaproteobacteria bacterium]|nr:Na+/H+ antiporter NhaC [Gammaproteobacteria bacterium]
MNNDNDISDLGKKTNLGEALALVTILVICICTAVILFNDYPTGGPIQLALTFTAFTGILVGFKNKVPWKNIERSISDSLGVAANAIFILFCVGALVGTWILSGTVPTMIFYGLHFLSPEIFFPTACLLCAIVSLTIGSSWTTMATVGLALVGICNVLGLSIPVTVGAIVSGAYFGDKMSPLSDTTNLSPAVAGSELFSHIRHMAWVSVPSFLISLILYTVIGLTMTVPISSSIELNAFTDALQNQFEIGIHLLIPLLILLFMAFKRVPALPTIFSGALIGALFAVIFQNNVVLNLANTPDSHAFVSSVKGITQALFQGYTSDSGVEVIDKLLNRGGMGSMTTTVWLILSAMLMAGVFSSIGVFDILAKALVRFTKSTGSLISVTLSNCALMNVIAGDQYISIIVPGQIWRKEYERRQLAAVNLSRCLEDAGTLTSALIPWTTCGAYIYGVLGLTTFTYIPFCFFNIINPIISAIYGYTGFTIVKDEKALPETA